MKIIANGINGNYLEDCLNNVPKEVEQMKIAVAFADDYVGEKIIDFCTNRKICLTFYGRLTYSYFHSHPIPVKILKKFLQPENFHTCKLVEEFFHSKVLWFQGYGAYIGSANLNNRSWEKNIECGVWFENEELNKFNLIKELDNFFFKIDQESNFLTEELLQKISEREKPPDLLKATEKWTKEFKRSVSPVLKTKFEGFRKRIKKFKEKTGKMKEIEKWVEKVKKTVSKKVS